MPLISYKNSRYQEQIIEYKFLSDLMIGLAYMNKELEILRVHNDSFGYDLILKVNEVIKYVQLKSRIKSGKAQYWDIHKTLLNNVNGIILIIYYEFNNQNIILEYNYLDYSKYLSTINNEPRYKKDNLKYCCVCAKDLTKTKSINDIINIMEF